MSHGTEEILLNLAESISKMNEVQAVGLTGSKTALPKPGEGDIDIFIYCDAVPSSDKRQSAMNHLGGLLQEIKTNVFEGKRWGIGDRVIINGVETWLMYFTLKAALNEVESILNGDYPDRVDNSYYPVGRCAMLENINILYEKSGFLSSLKDKLHNYPEKLAVALTQYHLNRLEDVEDLERGVSRKEVLFYHFALDIALDHFLQALFAINRKYFPSRKRTLLYVENFGIKPSRCGERLLEAVRLGSYPEGIGQSYSIWRGLVEDLIQLNRQV